MGGKRDGKRRGSGLKDVTVTRRGAGAAEETKDTADRLGEAVEAQAAAVSERPDPATREGLEPSGSRIQEQVRTLDDAGRFRCGWEALRDRARRESVPELHCDGWAETARLGERLDGAEGLEGSVSRAVAEWKETRDRQEALAGEVRDLCVRARGWLARRRLEVSPGPHDPADPARRAVREDGTRIRSEAEAMLADGSLHGPHLDAMPELAVLVRGSLTAVRDGLVSDRRDAFAWLVDEVTLEAGERKVPPFHAPRFGDLVALAGESRGDPDLPEADARAARAWLDRHATAEALVREIRDWPGQAEDLMKRRPGPDGDPDALAGWRAHAERSLAERRQMLCGEGPHAAHVASMPDERERMREASGRLDGMIQDCMRDELRGREAVALGQAEAEGCIAFDVPAWGGVMELVNGLDARGDLSDAVSREAGRLKKLDLHWREGRVLVKGVMNMADRRLGEHEDLSPEGVDTWLREAALTLWIGDSAAQDRPERELAAHLAADGRKPDAFAKAMDGIQVLLARELADRDRRKIDDDVLVLACAVSERVDAASPVHRGTLPGDVRAVLETSAQDVNVPESEVAGVAAGIARRRIETDIRVGLARRIEGAGNVAVARAQFEGDPRLVRLEEEIAYKAAISEGMRLLDREEPQPTRVETRVARAVVATRGTEGHGLALVMAEALELGTTAEAAEIRSERAALPGELSRHEPETAEIEGPDRAQAFLRRVCASFTGAEVREMCEGKGPVMERLPAGAARERAKATLHALHREAMSRDPSPWCRRQETLGRELGLVRDQ